MKKLFFGIGLCFLGAYASAQNGLEGIVVEKYYIANAADNAADPTLPIGAVTYRVYVDLLPGYKFKMAYGDPSHPLTISTTTTFYNEPNYGAVNPGMSATNAKKKTALLDTYLSVGGACAGYNGVMKTEDDGVGNFVISAGCLLNNSSRLGIALNTQDGMMVGTVPSFATVGTMNTDLFGDGSANGSTFTTSGATWTCMAGSTGPTASNKVLIGQFTTDGVFSFALNIQIQTPSNTAEKYVSSNPVSGEISISSLVQTWGPPVAPTVSVTAPVEGANIITGDAVTISANAADADGTVASVEFFVNGSSIGTDNSSPYSISWNSTAGNKAITARATDNEGDQTTSTAINVSVADNQAPSISISTPANAATFVTGDVVSILASASDVDGSVASVEFFVDGVSVGTDIASPFTVDYTSVFGPHTISAVATDDRGLTATSSSASISVLNNVPPTTSITAPVAGSMVTAPEVVTITANAADSDGSITKVEFYVNNVKVGEDLTSPYSYDWTSVIGSADLRVKATDNKDAAVLSSIVNINVADPNALPYAVVSAKNTCLPTTFALAVSAVDTVNNVIGYDLTINYEASKVTPTGVFTEKNDVLNGANYDISHYIDAANSKINVSLSLNANAPAGTFFHGVGELFTVEFSKTVNFTSVDTTTVSISSFQESYFNGVQQKLASAGKYSTYKDSTFVASIKFWKDSSAIQYNAADPNEFAITNVYGTGLACNNQSVVAVQPNTLGEFTYNIWNGEAISIQRDINDNVSVQSVINNGGDVFLAKKMITSNPTYTPTVFEVLAADVNLDGVISAGDVSQIQQRSVLAYPEFKQAWNYDEEGNSIGHEASRDWLFVDSTRLADNANFTTFSISNVPSVPTCLPVTVSNYSSCPLITAEIYKAILLGDINGNYKDIASNGYLKNSDMIVFNLDSVVETANYYDIPVSVSSTTQVDGIDFATKFNESKLSFDTVLDQTNYLDEVSYFNTNDRTLRVGATTLNSEAIQTNKTLIYLRFNKLNGSISASDFYSLEGYINGNTSTLQVISNTTSIDELANNVVNIYPNPAQNNINVVVSDNALVTVYDLNGNQVIAETSVNANEASTINVSNLANGIYSVKIFNNNFVKYQKIVITK